MIVFIISQYATALDLPYYYGNLNQLCFTARGGSDNSSTPAAAMYQVCITMGNLTHTLNSSTIILIS